MNSEEDKFLLPHFQNSAEFVQRARVHRSCWTLRTMDKSAVLVTVIVAALCVGLGIIIGYFAIERSTDASLGNPCSVSDKPSDR